jgi:hypothetical protein
VLVAPEVDHPGRGGWDVTGAAVIVVVVVGVVIGGGHGRLLVGLLGLLSGLLLGLDMVAASRRLGVVLWRRRGGLLRLGDD